MGPVDPRNETAYVGQDEVQRVLNLWAKHSPQTDINPFQELYKHNQADFAQVLRPVVKRAFQPTRVDMLPLALRQAFDTMVTGRPGPVNIDVPYNVYQEEGEVELPAASAASALPVWRSRPTPA